MGGNAFKYIAPVAGATLGAAFLGPMIAPFLTSLAGGATAGAAGGTIGAAGAGAGGAGLAGAGTAGALGGANLSAAALGPELAALGGSVSPAGAAGALGGADLSAAVLGPELAALGAGEAAIPTLFGMEVPTIAKALGGGVGGSLGSLAAGGDPLAGGAGGALIGGPIAGAFGQGKEKDVVAAGPTLGGTPKAAQVVKSASPGPIGGSTRPAAAIGQPQGGFTPIPSSLIREFTLPQPQLTLAPPSMIGGPLPPALPDELTAGADLQRSVFPGITGPNIGVQMTREEFIRRLMRGGLPFRP